MDAPDVVVVPHTHWDREWYRTFQGYRVRMVEVVERVLDLVEKGVLPHFLLDGQTVMLDDYLEIRPGDEDRIRAAVSSGKLGIGPWYILPDEFLVSGEAIVRNLLFGLERMERFGATGAVGYLPDMFGHTAQMPQILRGFGLDRAVLWRGVDPPVEHFWWEDLAGGGVATVFLPTGYCNTHLWWAELDPVDRLERHRKFLAEHRLGGPHLLLSGCDHLAPNPDLPALARAHGCRLGRLQDALPPAVPEGLPVVRGELRQSGRAYLLPDVASARTPLKLQNAELQDLWERSVEPLLALRVLAGDSIEPGFWREGWELILKNQPHDSICGCSIDEVHREMEARFSQARILGQELVGRSLDAFAPRTEAPGVMIFNPAAHRRSGWVEVEAEAPRGASEAWPDAHLEGVPAIFLGAEDSQRFYADIDYHPDHKPIRLYRFLAYFKDLLPMSVTHVPLAPGPGSPQGAPTDVTSGDGFIENAFVRIEVDGGRLQLTYKPTGETVRDLLRFVDEGDAGDEYTYSPPAEDRVVASELREYSVVESTPARAVLEVLCLMDVPAGLEPSRLQRSALRLAMGIRTRITLLASDQTVRFETRFENWAHDHRLRVLVGTGTTSPEHIASEVAFGAVPRHTSHGLGPLPVAPLAEAAPSTFPHLGWVAVEGARMAVQVLSPGLAEAEVVSDGVAVALTLLRSVGWLSRDDLRTRGGGAGPHIATPEAQVEGPHRAVFHVRYDAPAIAGRRAWWDALPELDEARHPVRIQASGGNRSPLARGLEPPPKWLQPVPAAAVLSALKPARDGNGMVVRAFNPTGEPRAFPLVPVASWVCRECDLAENALSLSRTRCEVLLEPGIIASFRLEPATSGATR